MENLPNEENSLLFNFVSEHPAASAFTLMLLAIAGYGLYKKSGGIISVFIEQIGGGDGSYYG